MATAVASNFSYATSASSHMPKMSTSKRGMDGGLSKKIVVLCNGDKFFKGKKMYIVPSRYHNFSDFLNDLTGKLPSVSSLPYGVRQIFSPTSGRKIRDIEDLSDGRVYVCAGFEQFRPLNYGEILNEPQRISRAQAGPRASANIRHRVHNRTSQEEDISKLSQAVREPVAQSVSRDIRSPKDNKSKLFVVISNAVRPRKIIRIFLSAHTFPTMDRLVNELQHQFSLAISSEAVDAHQIAAAAEFSSGKIRRLYSIHGVEITSPVDFFKVDDHYLALGSEKFTTADLKEIIGELYPNGTWPKNIFKSWENQRSRKRKPAETTAGATNAAVTTGQKPQQTVPVASKQKNEVDESTELSTKYAKTGKTGEVAAASGGNAVAAHPPPPLVASAVAVPASDSRSRIDGERMKKDSGFVDFGDATKTSESPNHHLHPGAGQSTAMSSVDHQQTSTDRSPRVTATEAPTSVIDLPTVFEAKSVDGSTATASVSLVPDNKSTSQAFATNQEQNEKALKPVQPPTSRKPAPIEKQPEPVPPHPTPGAVVSTNAPKSTKEVDPELAKVLDQQQTATGSTSVQKYAVLPDIRHSETGKNENNNNNSDSDGNNMEEDKPPQATKQVASLPAAETSVLERAVVDNSASNSPPAANPPAAQSQPAVKTSPQQDEKLVEIQQTASVAEQQQQPAAAKPAGHRPKLEHAPMMIDGRPESRPASRSSSAAPNSAPGRVVVGKLSRQLSKIDHIAARFEYVGKQLGDGNFAVVRRCRRRKSGAEYAMKIIDKAKLKGKFHMVENEIRIMRACDHQNLVKLHEMYETDKEIYLVMELVPDGDLFDAITAAVKFDEPTAAKMVQDMASGLFYLHSRRIVHRDLKPENLLVLRSSHTNSITLKLGDFGLAMEVTEPIYSVCGTPTYVAPEILTEKGYGLEVDLWALGVISYILMCGFPPFRSQKRRQSELFEQIKGGKFVFLSPYWDPISVLAKELISKLLVVDARRRYTAPDVLCHPWIISLGGSSHPSSDMAAYRKSLRKSLDEQSRANWKQWVSVRQKNGFNAILAGPAPGVRPSSRN